MHPPYPQTETKRRIIDGLDRGWGTVTQLGERPDFPCTATIRRWARADEVFAQQLAWTRTWWRGERRQAQRTAAFDPRLAEEMLARVRRGETVRRLVRTPPMPTRYKLNRWKRERPDFAAQLAAAAARRPRPRRWGDYEEAAADRIILRLSKGATMPEILADRSLPGIIAIRRWRRAEPGFDGALRIAQRAGCRFRYRRRRPLTPARREDILLALARGQSLRAISRRPDMPCLTTLLKWQRTDPDFAHQVAMAREDGAFELALGAAQLVEAKGAAAHGEAREIFKQIGRMRPRTRPVTDEP